MDATAPKDPKTDGQQREANGLDHLAQKGAETRQQPPEESKNTKKKRKKLAKDKPHSTAPEDGLQGRSLTCEGAVYGSGLPSTTQKAATQPGEIPQAQAGEGQGTAKAGKEQKPRSVGVLRIRVGEREAESWMRNNEEAGRDCWRHQSAAEEPKSGNPTTMSHRTAQECKITKETPLQSPTAKEVPATGRIETEAGHGVGSDDDATAQINNVKSLGEFGPGLLRWFMS